MGQDSSVGRDRITSVVARDFFFYQIRNLSVLLLQCPIALRPLPIYVSGPALPPLPLPSSPPNAPANKDHCSPRRIIRWQAPNPPRVPYSPGLHYLKPPIGHRAVHQLVEKLPQDWRVLVIERNTYVLLFPSSPARCVFTWTP